MKVTPSGKGEDRKRGSRNGAWLQGDSDCIVLRHKYEAGYICDIIGLEALKFVNKYREQRLTIEREDLLC